ncbi:MAG: salicylate hydroxylase [Betaproteobacteria bacterium]|nr:salicylate hydroxylase [Betaproteobacteria bacterium]
MNYETLSPRELRLEVEALYGDYAETLNDEAFEAWPAFFTERAFYQITSRENHERNLPIGLMRCESRGMLQDRVVAIRQTAYYGPRSIRRLISGVRTHGWGEGEMRGVLKATASYLAVETLPDELTRVFNAGKYIDELVVEDGALRFASRICVYDTLLIPNTLIYPL